VRRSLRAWPRAKRTMSVSRISGGRAAVARTRVGAALSNCALALGRLRVAVFSAGFGCSQRSTKSLRLRVI